MFSGYLEFQRMGKGNKPSDSECYTPSSETIILYTIELVPEWNKVKFHNWYYPP
jgi:hypothetical protein